MNKLVFLDAATLNPGDISWDGYSKFGECIFYDKTAPEDVISRIGDANMIFTIKVVITKEIMDACPNLKYIGVLATGYNTVDIEHAAKLGITVTNIPSYGTEAVSQYAMAMLLELTSKVAFHDKEVHEGKWINSEQFCFWNKPLFELKDKNVGVIGFGRIGRNFAKMAKAFDCNIYFYDEYYHYQEGDEAYNQATIDEIYEKCDAISLHCNLTKENTHFMNKEAFLKMKKKPFIVNTSRGPLIEEEGLIYALNNGLIKGAALDVINVEPMVENSPLLDVENLIITPHVAWAPLETRDRLMGMGVENVEKYLENNPINVVKPR